MVDYNTEEATCSKPTTTYPGFCIPDDPRATFKKSRAYLSFIRYYSPQYAGLFMNERREATSLWVFFKVSHTNMTTYGVFFPGRIKELAPQLTRNLAICGSLDLRWCDGSAMGPPRPAYFETCLQPPTSSEHLPSRCYQWQMAPGYRASLVVGSTVPFGLGEASLH